MSTFQGFVPEERQPRCPRCGHEKLLSLDRPEQFSRYVRAKLKGEDVELEIRKRRTKRSDRQNRAYHAMLTPWAMSEGHHIEDLKDDCLREVFGEREVVNVITGEVKKVLKEPHTSTLTVAQFNELMERTVEIAADCGVILELPDEYKARKAKEARQSKRRVAA